MLIVQSVIKLHNIKPLGGSMKRMKIVSVLAAISIYSISIDARDMGQRPGQVPLPGGGAPQSGKVWSQADAQKYAQYRAKMGWDPEEEEDEDSVEYGPHEPLRRYAKRRFDEKYADVQKELGKIRKRVFGGKITVANAITEIKKNNEELAEMQKDFKKAIELEENSDETKESIGYFATGVKDVFDKVKSVFVYSEDEKEIALWMIEQLEQQKKEYTAYYANVLGRSNITTIEKIKFKGIYNAIMEGLEDEINKQKVIAGKLWSRNQKYAMGAAGALATLGTVGYLALGKKAEPKKGEELATDQKNKETIVKASSPDQKNGQVKDNRWFASWRRPFDPVAKAKQDAEKVAKELAALKRKEELAQQQLITARNTAETLDNQQALNAAEKLREQKEEIDRKLKEAEENERAARAAMEKSEKAKAEAAAKVEADQIAAKKKKRDDEIQAFLKLAEESDQDANKPNGAPVEKIVAQENAEKYRVQAAKLAEYNVLYDKSNSEQGLTAEEKVRFNDLLHETRKY